MAKKQQVTIYVDADACPVKTEIATIGKQYKANIVFVSSYAHMNNLDLDGTWIFVDTNKEEADLYIMNHAKKNDVVVTQDIGLASLLVGKHVYAISPRGKVFLERDMDQVLHMRFLAGKERRMGNYTKGPSKFTNQDRVAFSNQLKNILSNFEGNLN